MEGGVKNICACKVSIFLLTTKGGIQNGKKNAENSALRGEGFKMDSGFSGFFFKCVKCV